MLIASGTLNAFSASGRAAASSASAALSVVDGTVHDVRLALGGVAHKPWRASNAEHALRGEPATMEAFRSAAEAELVDARPLADNAFKVPLAINMITEILVALAGGPR